MNSDTTVTSTDAAAASEHRSMATRARETTRRASEAVRLDQRIQEHPIAMVGAALATGFALSRLTSMAFRHRGESRDVEGTFHRDYAGRGVGRESFTTGETGGSLRKKAHQASESIASLTDRATSKISDLSSRASESLSSLGERASTSASATAEKARGLVDEALEATRREEHELDRRGALEKLIVDTLTDFARSWTQENLPSLAPRIEEALSIITQERSRSGSRSREESRDENYDKAARGETSQEDRDRERGSERERGSDRTFQGRSDQFRQLGEDNFDVIEEEYDTNRSGNF